MSFLAHSTQKRLSGSETSCAIGRESFKYAAQASRVRLLSCGQMLSAAAGALIRQLMKQA